MMFVAQAPPPEPPSAIVVVGKALPDPASERAYSVETIDRDRLEKAPSHQLDEVLKQVPGLQLFRRSDSTSGHPTSQGVTLRALGGNAASRALLILDGVPQADPFGGWVNWPAYDPAGLDQVRIVRLHEPERRRARVQQQGNKRGEYKEKGPVHVPALA